MLAATVLMSVAGCSTSTNNNPDKTMESFVSSLGELEMEKANTYLSEVLQETMAISMSERSDKLTESDVEKLDGYNTLEKKFKEISNDLSYTIDSSEVTDNKASIEVTLVYGDVSVPISKAFEKVLSESLDKNISEEESIENTFSAVNKELKNFKPKLKTVEGEVVLEKENEKWVISQVDGDIMNGLTNGVIFGFEEALSGNVD